MEYFYITNDVEIAKCAEAVGVDRVWLDLEFRGKDKRQKDMDTVKSKHKIKDIGKVKSVLTQAKIQVRINPIGHYSEKEINFVLSQGADYIMLPMFKTVEEAERFVKLVNGKAKTILLVETKDAVENLDDILKIEGIDEIHIGLNDLHRERDMTFMFELLTDGTVEEICKKISKTNIPYGFGGIGKIEECKSDSDMLLAEKILGEHYRLKSTRAILSRSFCNCEKVSLDEAKEIFKTEMPKIREAERKIAGWSEQEFEDNQNAVKKKVEEIVKKKKEMEARAHEG